MTSTDGDNISQPDPGSVKVSVRRWAVRAGAGLAVLSLGVVIGWAAVVVFEPPQDVLETTSFTTVQVEPGTVESSFSSNTVAEWTPTPVASNLASGIVTSIEVRAGDEIANGSALYSVDLRPVIAAEGATPAFRSLMSGASGADVRQLQMMLIGLGYDVGSPTGDFGWATTRAVRAWQKSLGLASDGVIQLGDLVFLPKLPARVSLDDKVISVGSPVTGSERAISTLPSSPSFRVPVTQAQAAQMPTGTRVDIVGPQGEGWIGFVVDQRPEDQGDTVNVILAGTDGAAICGDECDGIGVTGQTILRSSVVTLEAVSGLAVPSAALVSEPDGTINVIDEGGVKHAVTVLASAKGTSIIEGVAASLKVRIPAVGN